MEFIQKVVLRKVSKLNVSVMKETRTFLEEKDPYLEK